MGTSSKHIWHQTDIVNRLHTVQATLNVITITENQDPQQAAYKEGFEAALQCVALGFNLSLSAEENYFG